MPQPVHHLADWPADGYRYGCQILLFIVTSMQKTTDFGLYHPIFMVL